MGIGPDVARVRSSIGRVRPRERLARANLDATSDDQASLPGDIREIVDPRSRERLDTSYRPLCWTERQVVHHGPDRQLEKYAPTFRRPEPGVVSFVRDLLRYVWHGRQHPADVGSLR